MIPLMIPESAGKAPAPEVTAQTASSDGAEVAFGDVLASVMDAATAIDDAAALTSDASVDDKPDDTDLAIGEVKPEALPPTLGLAEQPAPVKTIAEPIIARIAKQQGIMGAPITADRKVSAGDAKVPIDAPAVKESGAQPSRPSFVQSAIESQLPDDNRGLMRLEKGQDPKTETFLPSTKDGSDKAVRAASGGSVVVGGEAEMPTAPSTKGAALIDASNAPDERRRERQDQKTAQPIVASQPSTPASAVNAPPPPAVALAQSMAAEKHLAQDVQGKTTDGELVLGVSGGERIATATPATHVSMLSGGTEMARQAGTQIAVAVNGTGGKATEIALNPEELGRVRMSMTAGDGTITLHLSAERPETHELLRRHVDILAQEFRALGYDTISFSFGPEGEQQQQDQQADDQDRPHPLNTTETTAPHQPPQIGPTSGLDLRI